MPEEINPKLDDFISKVVSDPAKPQETLLLKGFLGASPEPGHTRVYSDIALDNYVDVANADIIHIEPMPKETSPMGGSFLWVKKETEVLSGAGAGTLSAKAKFLEGPIASEAAKVSAQQVPAQPALAKTLSVVACHPSILLRACVQTGVQCFVTQVCPTRPVICDIAVSGGGPCVIPDPTIQEQTFQFQQAQQAGGAADFGVAAPGAQAVPDFGPGPFPTSLCPTPTRFGPHCVVPTPACATHQVACRPTFAPSVCFVCPTSPVVCHFTVHGIECPVQTLNCPQQTPACPQHFQTIACGEHPTGTIAQFGLAAAPQAAHLLPSVSLAACPSVAGAVCHPTPECPTPLHRCPSQLCPTPRHMCPSVAGFQCPSVNQFHCPSVGEFHCPSVGEFHCPSVNSFHCPSVLNWHCPPRTAIPEGCPPTPQIQHCPTPNMICPQPTSQCPSVMEICATTSPLFC